MLKNRDGMTLIEVMVAAAIMLIMALAFSSLMFQQSNQQRSANAKATFNSLVNSIQGAASNARILRNSADAVGPPAGGNGGNPINNNNNLSQ